jgi:hypothetical protein
MGIKLEREDTPIWEELAEANPEVIALLNHEDKEDS